MIKCIHRLRPAACIPLLVGLANDRLVPALAQQAGETVSKNILHYPRTDIPKVEIPPYNGQRYEDRVPVTLDLAEMAGLCVNALTEATNPAWDYELYGWGDLYRNPPGMAHNADRRQFKYREPCLSTVGA